MNRSNDPLFDSRIADWLEDDPHRAPGHVLDTILAALPSISQRRRLPVPWRIPLMPNSMRLAAAAVIGVVALGVIYLNLPGRNAVGGVSPSPSAGPTEVAPGITGWTTYTSDVYYLGLSYPEDWSIGALATRKWQAGDRFPPAGPYADAFVSPGEGDAQIALFGWDIALGTYDEAGPDLRSVEGLKAWAETFCNDAGLTSSCSSFTQRAVPMCLNTDRDACKAAILVPAEQQYAFFMNADVDNFLNFREVNVVVVAREDNFPPAARYGGSVQLLKSILTKMNVWTPGQPRI